MIVAYANTIYSPYSFCAAIVNSILEHFGIKHHIRVHVLDPGMPLEAMSDPPGPDDVVVDPAHTFSWLAMFNDLKALMPDVCANVIHKYEAKLNTFGYSLHQPLARRQSALVQDMLVPPMSTEDCNKATMCWAAF